MRVFLSGVGCVGKTTIGLRLAKLMGRSFFYLDTEIEQFIGMPVERLQQKYWMPHDFRKQAAKALSYILDKPEKQQAVIALPPSGLMGGYLAVIKKTQGLKVALLDTPERILDRIVFYIEKYLGSGTVTRHPALVSRAVDPELLLAIPGHRLMQGSEPRRAEQTGPNTKQYPNINGE